MADPRAPLPHDILYVQELVALTAQAAAGLARDRPPPGSERFEQQEAIVHEFRSVLKEAGDRLPTEHPLLREVVEVYRAAGDVLAHGTHPDTPGAAAALDGLAAQLGAHADEPELPTGPSIAREWGSASEHGAPTPLDVPPIAREWGSASDVPTATAAPDADAVRGAIAHLSSVSVEHAARILDFTRASTNTAEVGNQILRASDPHDVVRLADADPLERQLQARAELTTYQQMSHGAEVQLARMIETLPVGDPLRQQAEQAIDVAHQLNNTGGALFDANLEFVGDQARGVGDPGLRGIGTDSPLPDDEEVILDARAIVALEAQVVHLGNQAQGLADSTGAAAPAGDDSGFPAAAQKPTDPDGFRLPPTFPQADGHHGPAGDWGSASGAPPPPEPTPVAADPADDLPG